MIDIVNKLNYGKISQFKNNKAVLIASHDMNEVKRLCDRVYVIVDGKIIVEGSPTEISFLLKLPCEIKFPLSTMST